MKTGQDQQQETVHRAMQARMQNIFNNYQY